MQRESMVFYRSLMEATDKLDADDYKTVMSAVLHYAMDGKEPDLQGIDAAIFTLIKPQIDANNTKYENGKKGGRPKVEKNQTITKPKPNHNLNKTKVKPNHNQTETKPKPNVNVNVNDNVNDNDNVNVNEEHKRTALTSTATYTKLINIYGKDFIDERINRAIKYKNIGIGKVAEWCKTDCKGKKGFNNFHQREYDFEELEKKINSRRQKNDA